MIQGPEDQADWVRVSEAAEGPSTDYSNLGKCTGENDLARANIHMVQIRVYKKGLVHNTSLS